MQTLVWISLFASLHYLRGVWRLIAIALAAATIAIATAPPAINSICEVVSYGR